MSRNRSRAHNNMGPRPGATLEARVSVVETSLSALHEDMDALSNAQASTQRDMQHRFDTQQNHMVSGFSELREAINARGQTNWTLVIQAALFIIAVFGAAIYPMNHELIRQAETDRVQLTQMAATKKATRDNEQSGAVRDVKLHYLQRDIDRLDKEGSPEVRARLAVIEAQMAALRR